VTWSSRKLRVLLIGSVILTLLWYGARGFWYDAYFRRAERIEMMIICDTTVFATAPERVMVLYDRLALSPVSVALGLYQQRPPERVQSFHFHEHKIAKIAADALFLEDLPAGPISRVIIAIGEHNYYLSVSDRYAGGGRLILHAEWPGGVRQAPVLLPGE
jgi:hypothetical protein